MFSSKSVGHVGIYELDILKVHVGRIHVPCLEDRQEKLTNNKTMNTIRLSHAIVLVGKIGNAIMGLSNHP